MASKLTPKDLEFIDTIRRAGVLQDVKDHLIDQSKGVILITCSDGDRFPDIFQHQVRLQAGQRSDPRIHTFAWHGGALACAPCSPINRRKYSHDIFLSQISDGREMKDIDVVILLAHALCGAASRYGLSIQQTISLLVRAKDRIKKLNHGITCPCFYHVDYGDKMRTYFLSRERWEQWAPRKVMMAVA